MAILVVGSVALDTIKTPFGTARNALGGSATYFSLAASLSVPVNLVAVVGRDFPRRHVELLRRRPIDLTGLEVARGRTFRWSGEYHLDMNTRTTRALALNVFAAFRPKIPGIYADSPIVFLANIDPALQLAVLRQIRRPRLVACDTMDHWIRRKRSTLIRLLRRVDVLTINDEEARLLAQTPHLRRAGRELLRRGPSAVIIKKGEHGSLLFRRGEMFFAPAYPLEDVVDPTGAGDTFAGGVLGYLARQRRLTAPALRRAMLYGTALASFCVEQFGVARLTTLTRRDMRRRLQAIQSLMRC